MENSERPPKKTLLAPTLAKRFPLNGTMLEGHSETPEFHDPYSELNLFLSQKIKKEMHHCSNPRKWSVKLQDELMQKITPEFEQKFPKYRLGVAALKRTWEKVSYYSMQIQDQKEALSQDGKLNIAFLIKENLKSFAKQRNICQLHPYHYAHQLAVKMSECIAIVDGTKPKLDQLTRTIWSMHRHLIPNLSPQSLRSPYDEYDKLDKLIVRRILELTSKYPRLPEHKLTFLIQEDLSALAELLATLTDEEIQAALETLITEKISPALGKLPYRFTALLENELASALIEKNEALTFFKEARQLNLSSVDERKIQTWTVQSEMLCRWIRIQNEGSLYKLVSSYMKDHPTESFTQMTSQICWKYLGQNPHLLPFATALTTRIWTMLKHAFYTQFPDEDASTFDRFLTWHGKQLKAEYTALAPEALLERLKELCQEMLPLAPFDSERAYSLLFEE